MSKAIRMIGSRAFQVIVGGVIIGGTLAGCRRPDKPQPLKADAFYTPGVQVLPEKKRTPTAVAGSSAAPVGSSVRSTTTSSTAASVTDGRSTTIRVAAAATTMQSGQYMTLGAMIAEVNGVPIYADKVIAALTPALSAEARQREETAFRKFAGAEIKKQVDTLIRAELVFAQASRNIAQSEKDLATRVTEDWRRQQVTLAGGSIEQARAKAAADGQDFDDLVKEQYRTFVVQVYRQRHLFPRVQVTADDIRKYYDRNLSKFSVPATAQFRVIKIDPKKIGSLDDARKRAEELRTQAANGADFAELARNYTHDPALAKTGGDVGLIDKGAYANTAVEDAAWSLQPGGVAPVVGVRDVFYIVKLEAKNPGETRPFDDQTVQESIREFLRRQQMGAMIEKSQNELVANAIINPYPPPLDAAIEMAMQKYPIWSKAK